MGLLQFIGLKSNEIMVKDILLRNGQNISFMAKESDFTIDGLIILDSIDDSIFIDSNTNMIISDKLKIISSSELSSPINLDITSTLTINSGTNIILSARINSKVPLIENEITLLIILDYIFTTEPEKGVIIRPIGVSGIIENILKIAYNKTIITPIPVDPDDIGSLSSSQLRLDTLYMDSDQFSNIRNNGGDVSLSHNTTMDLYFYNIRDAYTLKISEILTKAKFSFDAVAWPNPQFQIDVTLKIGNYKTDFINYRRADIIRVYAQSGTYNNYASIDRSELTVAAKNTRNSSGVWALDAPKDTVGTFINVIGTVTTATSFIGRITIDIVATVKSPNSSIKSANSFTYFTLRGDYDNGPVTITPTYKPLSIN